MTQDKNCPRCRIAFAEEIRYEDVPVDRCAKCGGIWLDEGELRPILKARTRKFSAEEVRSTRSRRRKSQESMDPELPCTRCGCLMARFRYEGANEIVLDHCPGHGIWFDKDELEEVQMAVEEREIAESLKDERPATIFEVARSIWK